MKKQAYKSPNEKAPISVESAKLSRQEMSQNIAEHKLRIDQLLNNYDKMKTVSETMSNANDTMNVQLKKKEADKQNIVQLILCSIVCNVQQRSSETLCE